MNELTAGEKESESTWLQDNTETVEGFIQTQNNQDAEFQQKINPVFQNIIQ